MLLSIIAVFSFIDTKGYVPLIFDLKIAARISELNGNFGVDFK